MVGDDKVDMECGRSAGAGVLRRCEGTYSRLWGRREAGNVLAYVLGVGLYSLHVEL